MKLKFLQKIKSGLAKTTLFLNSNGLAMHCNMKYLNAFVIEIESSVNLCEYTADVVCLKTEIPMALH